MHLAKVSIILVNFRGIEDTLQAISNLQNIDWPRELLELVVVENASGDDSLKQLKALGDQIVLVEAPENLGFAGGCNLGVKHSTGAVIGLLNNDARPDAQWVRAAMDTFAKSSKIGAVASKVLDWEGTRIDYIDAALTWFGMGYKPNVTQPISHFQDEAKDVLFGTGAAMFIRREVYEELEGFDERFFMFFEDVDLGWRVNLAGYRFVYQPDSIAYHKHHASMSKFGAYKETYLLEKNALLSMYKNLGEETLHRNLAGALALAVRRATARGKLDSTSLDLRKPGSEAQSEDVSRDTLATIYGIDQFVQELPGLEKSRKQIQSNRKVSEAKIWTLFGNTNAPSFGGEQFLSGYVNIIDALDVIHGPQPQRVLIITGDPIGTKMAGPAIRAWNMAEALSAENAVTLASFSNVESVIAPFDVVHVPVGDERRMRALEEQADVIIFQGLAMALFRCIKESTKILVCDIYDPMHLEHLEQGREHPRFEWEQQVSSATQILNDQLLRGDFFLCASERQRHFYLGQLAALGRINPANYAEDPDLNRLIGVVPFGLNPTPPRHERAVLKGVRPGIAPDDKILLWAGGVYNWFDPKNLIRAVAELAKTRPNVRLFFQGTKHPNPGVPEMAIVAESRQLARELGVLDTHVLFNDSWVDYADRQNYLTEADAGVSTHFAHVETTFSFRTRILDYLWADLPMVVTAGDHFADVVREHQLGVVVEANDVAALTNALEQILFDEDYVAAAKERIRQVKVAYEWHKVLAPVVDFVRTASRAADREHIGAQPISTTENLTTAGPISSTFGLKRDLQLVRHYLKHGGVRAVVLKAGSRLKRRFR